MTQTQDFDVDKINWDRLTKSYITLRPLQLDKDRLKVIYDAMVKTEKYLPDELRTPERVMLLINHYFGEAPTSIKGFHLFWEINNFDGIFGLTDIFCTYKAGVTALSWNRKKAYTHTFLKDVKRLLQHAMQELALKRISLVTPDERTVRMAKLVGGRVEARQKYGFIDHGKLMTRYIIRAINEEVL